MKKLQSYILAFGLAFGIGITPLTGCTTIPYALTPMKQVEIKSPNLFTWFEGIDQKVVELGIEFKIDEFPKNIPGRRLYFWALTVSFTDTLNHKNLWGHLGLQYTRSCKSPKNKCANWGGGGSLKNEDYGCGGKNLIQYSWDTNKWYKYIIKRESYNKDGTWNWSGTIINDQNKKVPLDTIIGGEFIASNILHPRKNNPYVMTETGYGIRYDSLKSQVSWRSPYIKNTNGKKLEIPNAIVTYNDRVSQYKRTNQRLIRKNPKEWIHQINVKRTLQSYEQLWN